MPMFDPVKGTYVHHPSGVKPGPQGSFFPRSCSGDRTFSWSLREKVVSTEMDPQTEGCAGMLFSEYGFRKCVQLSQRRLSRDQTHRKTSHPVCRL